VQLLVEAGPTLIENILGSGAAQQIIMYQAPILIGPHGKKWSRHDFTNNGTHSLPELQKQFEQWHVEKVSIIGDRDVCTELITSKLQF
jgi:riboflavin biosynthesis pyrimidine reductase